MAWHALLARHACLLAGMAGILSWRYPLPGVVALLLLTALMEPRKLPLPQQGSAKRIFLYALFFLAGMLLAARAEVTPLAPEALPAWVEKAVTPKGKYATDSSFSHGVAVTGTVLANERLSDGRTRFILKNVTAANEAEPLPGRLMLTWLHAPPYLENAGPGTRIAASLRLRQIRSFANPGTWETESYWRDRGVFFRAWEQNDGSRRGKVPPAAVTGEPTAFWKTREALRAATVTALVTAPFPIPAENNGNVQLSQPASFIPALLFGDRSFCSRETLDLVAKATLAHSLALSGMHLGFAAAIGYGGAWLIGFLFPTAFLRLPRQKAGILMALPVCAAYLWLGGAPPSLLRAALMLLFWAALLWMNRPKVLVDGLIWAVAVILLLSPASLYDIRLQLSAVSVAGIAFAAPLLEHLNQRMRRMPRIIRAAACMAGVSVAAQLAVLPIVLDAFPGTGMWFPLNLLWLPVLGMWVMPLCFAGLACVALGMGHIASWVFYLAHLPCEALLALLHWMDANGILIAPVAPRPEWVSMAGYWLLILLLPALLLRKNIRKTTALAATALCLMAFPPVKAYLDAQNDRISLTVLDVGQGQSVLVTWQGQGRKKGRALIDGGGFGTGSFDVGRQIVTPVLTANALPRLDLVVNSHPDADHLQGLLFPLTAFSVKEVALGPENTRPAKTHPAKAHPGKTHPDGQRTTTKTAAQRDTILQQRGITPRTVRAGETLTLSSDLVLEVLHPGETTGKSSNDNALVLRLTLRGEPLALICGDIEKRGVRELLQTKAALDADVLIVPHHGSAGSFSPPLYDAVKPKLAVASCGYANSWHFPAENVREALRERNVPLLTTADHGQITVTWEKGVMTVRTARPPLY
ncbi:MAG: hypothetical protein DELT_02698 [Desulfovibrio sp.]